MKSITVIQLSLKDAKSRRKALDVANDFPGVQYATLLKNDQMEVIGDGLNEVKLILLLREEVGYADLVTKHPILSQVSDTTSDPKLEPSSQALDSAATSLTQPLLQPDTVVGVSSSTSSDERPNGCAIA